MDSVAQRAADDYDRLLRDEKGLAQEMEERLFDRMRQGRLTFGGRVLCPFVRPNFVSAAGYGEIRRVCALVMGAVRAAERALGPELWDRVGLTPDERELARIEPGYGDSSPTSRLDSFLTPAGYRFVELNAESPAGIAYNEVLAELFLGLPLLRRFQERWSVRSFSARERLLETLLACYREAGGIHDHPTIAIVDYDEVPTRTEHHLFREFFAERGYPSVVCDPRDLTYEGRVLRHAATPIDVVYRRLLVNELLDRRASVQPLLQAARDGTVTIVNPFRCKPLHKKAIFAVITDDDVRGVLTDEQRQAVDAHVPWTRRLAEGHTRHGSEEVDLPDYVRRHRERLVMKPNDEYGGKGVYIGADMTDGEWEVALGEALSSPYVVQERVDVQRQPFPELAPELRFSELVVDLDPFLFRGEVEGLLTRLSRTSLANVSSGGGQVPAFVVEPSRG